VIKEHGSNFVLSVAFSPDSRFIISSADQKDQSKINYIYIWPANIDYMADLLCSKLERNLTQKEWETYVGADIDYRKTCPNK